MKFYLRSAKDLEPYDELKDYCNRMNEPISVIATKAIKKYIDVG